MLNGDTIVTIKRVVLDCDACKAQLVRVEECVLERVAEPQGFIDDEDICDPRFLTCIRSSCADNGDISLWFVRSVVRRYIAFAACVR